MLNYITWKVNPAIFQIFNHEVRWYGLFFALGLIVIGPWIFQKMWQHEKLPDKWLEKLYIYVILGTIIGARLAHVLFYDPEYYLANPIEILKVWEGGLASHGGTIGIIIAVYFFSKKVSKTSMLWVLDRLVVPTGLVAAMIRLGNLFNHEIYGIPTDLSWGFRFITNIETFRHGAEPIFSLPSHPTQIYEALAYFITFGLMMWLYWKRHAERRPGLLFGIFILVVFGFRFLVEFIKNDQEAFEANLLLNMGQILSIPFMIVGIFFIIRSLRKAVADNTSSPQSNH